MRKQPEPARKNAAIHRSRLITVPGANQPNRGAREGVISGCRTPLAMAPKLPPPDPFESLGMAPQQEQRMDAPTAVYVGASPTPEIKRFSSLILDLRPGALIVVAPRP